MVPCGSFSKEMIVPPGFVSELDCQYMSSQILAYVNSLSPVRLLTYSAFA
jgi:hypothetical protein